MSHTYDVIKIEVNEGSQNIKTYSQMKMIFLHHFLNIFPIKYDKKQGRADLDFHRRPSEGQEIDRRLKMKTWSHFRGFG